MSASARSPDHSRFGSAARFAALAAIVAISSHARAQVAYSEPPDLPQGPVGAAVGTVASGLNSVSGSFTPFWGPSGTPTNDSADVFQFVVPVGMEVTGIDVVVTGSVCVACPIRAQVLVAGLGSVNINANGTFTVPISASGGTLPVGTYSVQLAAFTSASSAGAVAFFNYQFRITAAQTNDSCAFARPVGLGATPFDTSAATTDGPDHPALCNFFGNPGIANDVWFTFTPPVSGTLTVDTCGTTFDTELAIYQGTSCASLGNAFLACNDDNAACGAGSNDSLLSLVAFVGQAYLIRVGGFGAGAGPGTLNLSIDSTGACCGRSTGGCAVVNQADCITLGADFVGFGVACTPTTCTACPVDFNHSGVVSVQDIFDFLAAYFVGCP